MYILYALNGDTWQEYARFADRRNYAERVAQAVENKLQNGKTDEVKNAAIVMRSFVLGNEYYEIKYGKIVKRALRHFDEVGLSNDIFDELECLLDEDFVAFALAKDTQEVSTFTQGIITVSI